LHSICGCLLSSLVYITYFCEFKFLKQVQSPWMCLHIEVGKNMKPLQFSFQKALLVKIYN
jgi:hypothetical protein